MKAQDHIEAALQEFAKAEKANAKAQSEKQRRLAGRQAYEAIAAICEAYSSDPSGQTKFPPKIAQALGILVSNALAGRPTKSFRDLFATGKKSAPRLSTSEIKDMKIAVAYLQAVKEGLIDDKTPVKTVAAWNAVSERTIHSWKNKLGTADIAKELFPEAGKADRAELIASLAKKCGAFVARHGRGHAALNARKSKSRSESK